MLRAEAKAGLFGLYCSLLPMRFATRKIYLDNSWTKKDMEGFPGGAVVESPLVDAGDTGSCRGLGRSHMPRSGWAREPWLLSLRVRSLCSTTGEATTVRGPRTTKKHKKPPKRTNKTTKKET